MKERVILVLVLALFVVDVVLIALVVRSIVRGDM